MTKRKKSDRPENDHRQWEPDDPLLLDLVRRHVPISQICLVLGRTDRAVRSRLTVTHAEAWTSSGHPESAAVKAPHAVGGMQGNAMARHEAIMSRLEALDAKVSVLLRALTSDEAPSIPAPNGRHVG